MSAGPATPTTAPGSGAPAAPARHTWGHIAALLAFGAVVFLPCLGQERRLDGREIRHAEIAREMAEGGNYAVPLLFGRPYVDKPPLFNLCVAVLFRLTGRVDFLVARLPSALCAIGAMVAIYALGRRWFSGRAGIYGAVVWATTSLVVEWGRFSRMDMMMACLVLLGTLLADVACTARRTAARDLLWCAASLVVAGAVLAKGPYAAGFFCLAVVALWRARKGRWLPPLRFAAVLVVVVGAVFAAWALAAEASHPGHLRALLRYQFGEAMVEHRRRLCLYFDQLALRGAPWWVFAPGAVWWVVRRIRRRGYDVAAVPVLAFASGILLLTVAQNKRAHYLLPILPMWALFIGGFLAAARGARHSERPPGWAFHWPLVLCLGLWVVAGAAGAVLLGGLLGQPASLLHLSGSATWPPQAFRLAAVVLAATAACALAGVVAALTRQPSRALALLCVAAGLLAAAIPSLTARYYPRGEGRERLAGEVVGAVPPTAALADYETRFAYLSFKLNRPLLYASSLAQVRAFLGGPGPRYVVTTAGRAAGLIGAAPRPLRRVGAWDIVGHDIALLATGDSASR